MKNLAPGVERKLVKVFLELTSVIGLRLVLHVLGPLSYAVTLSMIDQMVECKVMVITGCIQFLISLAMLVMLIFERAKESPLRERTCIQILLIISIFVQLTFIILASAFHSPASQPAYVILTLTSIVDLTLIAILFCLLFRATRELFLFYKDQVSTS